ASYLALQGNPVGLVLWLLFALVRMLFMRFSISKGYHEGVNLLGSLTNNLNKITRAANIIGLTVIGALIPSVVKANLNFEFSYGEVSLKLQSIADQIMPGLIPLLVVGFTWWLLGLKKMNSTRVIFVLIALGIIGYNLNIFG
ncbi:PTS fructose transporter subunit IID, partial [Klebsiella michiganensis]